MKKKALILTIAGIMLSLNACKPTENNYKAAYDQARHKKETVDADADILNSGKIIDEEKVSESTCPFQVDTKYVTGYDNPERYLFVIAGYRMSTNAKAQVASMKEKGYDAQAISAGDEEWYVSAGKFATESEAVAFGENYVAKHKNQMWIGLKAPIIIKIP